MLIRYKQYYLCSFFILVTDVTQKNFFMKFIYCTIHCMNKQLLDLYSDYLISSFNQTTATGLSKLLDGSVSHDKISRFLAERKYGACTK